MYALFPQPVVGFWGLRPHTPTWAPSLDPMGDFRPQIPNLLTPGKNPAGAHGIECMNIELASRLDTQQSQTPCVVRTLPDLGRA